MGNGNTQSRAGSAFGIVCDYIKNFNVELLSKSSENGADQKGSKKAEGHGSQGINQIGLDGDADIFRLRKSLILAADIIDSPFFCCRSQNHREILQMSVPGKVC